MKFGGLCAALLFAATAAAQGYPARTIQVISPVQAGSAGDTSLRIFTQKMAENMGQAIVVENLPGAAGMIGADRRILGTRSRAVECGFCARRRVGSSPTRSTVSRRSFAHRWSWASDQPKPVRSFFGGWFRTGDLGRIDADGYVFVSGRIKEMINRGGEKISPVQIDSALESCVGVAEAAAFGVPHPSLGEELVAAVVREANVAIDEADIIDHVRRRLGPRQLPRRIHFLERLPRTESGKVQRSVLTREFGSDGHGTTGVGSTAASSVASALEAGLTRLWSTLFRDRAVGRHDDFFLLGGDSFSGTQLLARVNAEFGTELTLKALLEEAATIAGMARTIERGRGAAPRPSSGLPGAPQAPAG